MEYEFKSPCKIKLLLNILGKRPDGFHDLETIFLPVQIHDRLVFSAGESGIQLTCSDIHLPIGPENLVQRAAQAFFQAAGIPPGIRIHLEKKIPVAAGLGGGSGNAAITLRALNEIFNQPLDRAKLHELAAGLGSDVPFFLYDQACLGEGRGERLSPLGRLPALEGSHLLLIHPGFGVPTAWAYQQLAKYPDAQNGIPGRAAQLAKRLSTGTLKDARSDFFNALEAPVLPKYPFLALVREFLAEQGATVSLMSGSGSSLFAILPGKLQAESLRENFQCRFGLAWNAVVPLSGPEFRQPV
jgi:4-diphosphocytidyl-2-C-methyl-D-erythritol kinase